MMKKSSILSITGWIIFVVGFICFIKDLWLPSLLVLIGPIVSLIGLVNWYFQNDLKKEFRNYRNEKFSQFDNLLFFFIRKAMLYFWSAIFLFGVMLFFPKFVSRIYYLKTEYKLEQALQKNTTLKSKINVEYIDSIKFKKVFNNYYSIDLYLSNTPERINFLYSVQLDSLWEYYEY